MNKMNVSKLCLTVFSMVFIPCTSAENICNSYLEKTVNPEKAAVLWKQLARVPSFKGEYETTSSFEDRVSLAMESISAPVIVEVPVQKKYIVYNADTKHLDIQRYAFSNGITQYSGIFGYGTPFDGKIKYGLSENINIVFPSEDTELASYIGANAIGVKIRVRKVKRLTRVIFEREAQWMEGLFSISHDDQPVISFSDVSPEMAKHVKDTARAAIVFIPKPPFFAKGKYPWSEPTIEAPLEINETIEVAIGDIQCALFMNSNGKVYGTVLTR